MDTIDRERRRLYRVLGYGWGALQGTPAQVEWAEGWRETFVHHLCLWLALKQSQYTPDDYAKRVEALRRDYVYDMKQIRAAAWWLDHYKEASYPITPYDDTGMRRFMSEAVREGRRIQGRIIDDGTH